jgi:hypothetical protein
MLSVVTGGHRIRTNLDGLAEYLNAFPDDGTRSYTPASPVNGRPARWGSKPGRVVLQWEYLPDAWAQIEIGGLPDPEATAYRVAESVRFGADVRLSMPMRVRNLPGGLRPVEAVRSVSASRWNAQISYARPGDRQVPAGRWPVTVAAQSEGELVGNPTTTIDGHPAHVWHESGGQNVLQVDLDGPYVLVLYDNAVAGLFPAGLEGLYQQVDLYPDPADWR